VPPRLVHRQGVHAVPNLRRNGTRAADPMVDSEEAGGPFISPGLGHLHGTPSPPSRGKASNPAAGWEPAGGVVFFCQSRDPHPPMNLSYQRCVFISLGDFEFEKPPGTVKVRIEWSPSVPKRKKIQEVCCS